LSLSPRQYFVAENHILDLLRNAVGASVPAGAAALRRGGLDVTVNHHQGIIGNDILDGDKLHSRAGLL
jgi:hypothetical protein